MKHITLFTLILGLFVCCNKNNDSEYFNGNIMLINDSQKIIKNISSKSVSLFGSNFIIYMSKQEKII